jgi:geranylgeranyl pyrophosphate synthase
LATSCRVGAIVADLPRPVISAVTEFGQHYGMAFQIVDDILDVVASDEELGKPSGNDLVEGIYNLPVLHALRSARGDELRTVLGDKLEPEEREQARSLVKRSGAIESALVVAQRYADEAATALAPLQGTVAGRSLGAAADDLMARVAAAANR